MKKYLRERYLNEGLKEIIKMSDAVKLMLLVSSSHKFREITQFIDSPHVNVSSEGVCEQNKKHRKGTEQEYEANYIFSDNKKFFHI